MHAAHSSEQVEELEQQLLHSLRPVHPNPQFVDHLHDRLTTSPSIGLERKSYTAISLLLVAFSLLSGALVVWLVHLLRPSPVSQG